MTLLSPVTYRVTLMIKSFKHKGLERFFRFGTTAGIQAQHANKLRLILGVLESATDISDMDTPALKGDRSGIWSVRVSGNWRVTFRFVAEYAEIINYEDYH